MTTTKGFRRVLVCKSVIEANAGGIATDVQESALAEAFQELQRLEPEGAAKICDISHASYPKCPLVMPKSMRLLRVRHHGDFVGVVVPSFKGGKAAQQSGIISEGSGNPIDRSNIHRFFEGGTIGWD